MKTFSKDFFQIKNFIKERIDFNYSSTDEGAYHIAYNVNDGFIHIMGVSVVSVLENNKDKNFVVHIFVDGYSPENLAKIEEMAKQWQCHCIVYLLDMTPFNDFHIKVVRFSRITYARIYMPKSLRNTAISLFILMRTPWCAIRLLNYGTWICRARLWVLFRKHRNPLRIEPVI